MKIETLKKRLDRDRPMTSITLRMPDDVVEDLKRIAPLLGFSGYQPLLRTYVGQGLRKDLEQLEGDKVSALVSCLKRHGVSEKVIEEALAEAIQGLNENCCCVLNYIFPFKGVVKLLNHRCPLASCLLIANVSTTE